MSGWTERDWDHERDSRKHDWRPGDAMPLDQRLALARLIGYSEAIAAAGLIGAEMEAKLRTCIAETLVAFKMPSSREQADAH